MNFNIEINDYQKFLRSDTDVVQQQVEKSSQDKVNQEVTTKSVEISEKENSSATKVALSKLVTSPLNQLISQEDTIIGRQNFVKNAYDSLSDIRLQLTDLLKTLDDTDDNDIASLDKLDSASNELLDKVFDILKKGNNYGIKNKFINLYTKGLTSIKGLNIKDKTFIANIDSLMTNIIDTQNSYKKILEETSKESTDIANKIDNLANTDTKSISNSNSNSVDLQAKIISNPDILKSLCSNLSLEVVKRLI